ncbi:hypothetical protein PoB_007280300 [Plakobranchus ocellatus]|uniref:Uncharacterized protein n=1 Tax=Plakobranchus ocellatus TaxID=259542 RepID=A0AAV4DQG2_9GAST|nr:hypothetical protein PoB_007280300 [Plakobranchus ocellatus]
MPGKDQQRAWYRTKRPWLAASLTVLADAKGLCVAEIHRESQPFMIKALSEETTDQFTTRDLKLSGLPSRQGAGGGARTHDGRICADLMSKVSPCHETAEPTGKSRRQAVEEGSTARTHPLVFPSTRSPRHCRLLVERPINERSPGGRRIMAGQEGAGLSSYRSKLLCTLSKSGDRLRGLPTS